MVIVNTIKRKSSLLGMVLIFASISIILLIYIFRFSNPNTVREIQDISDGWEQSINGEFHQIVNTRTGFKNQKNNYIFLSRQINENFTDAAISLSYHHQLVDLYLDGKLLFQSYENSNEKNAGMGLVHIMLPENYIGKNLQLRVTSPYQIYCDFLGYISIGSIQSLEGNSWSLSMFHLFIMFSCITIGLLLITLFVIDITKENKNYEILYLGVFSILWGLYSIVTDPVMNQFFSPYEISVAFHFLHLYHLLPLCIYLYSMLPRFKKILFFSLIGFSTGSIVIDILYLFKIVDLPDLNMPINILLIFFLPIIVCLILEIRSTNAFVKFVLPALIILLISAIFLIINYIFYTFSFANDLYIFSMFLFIIAIGVYNILEILSQIYKEKAQKNIMHIKSNFSLDNYEILLDNFERTKIIRHEIHNHILALKLFCKQNAIEKVDAYVLSIEKEYDNIIFKNYSGNQLVDSILFHFKTLAIDNNINFKYEIKIDKTLTISDIDLSSFLMNLMENSVEACLCIPEKQDRWIDFEMQQLDQVLFIQCSNSRTMDLVNENNRLLTTKNINADFHGYGISIMKDIAAKYHNMLDITYSHDSFCIKSSLLL